MKVFEMAVWTIRMSTVSFFIISFIYCKQFDSALQYIWTYLRETRFVQHDSCEALLSVITFFILILLFRYLDQKCPSMRPYRLDYSQTKQKPMAKDQFFGMGYEFWAVFWYLCAICAYDMLYPRRTLPVNAPCWIVFVIQLSFGVFMYDFIFYWIHLLMHKNQYLFKFHKKHHEWNQTLRASETVRHSFIDASLQVITNIMVQNIGNKHPLSRLAHNVLIIYLLVEAHSGYDFPCFSHNICPCLFGGSVRHNIHHQRGDIYYHQFFKYLDDYS
eukprot:387375_1